MRVERELRKLHALRRSRPVSCEAEVLYMHLVLEAGAAGRYDVSDAYLVASLGITPHRLRKARAELAALGIAASQRIGQAPYSTYTLLQLDADAFALQPVTLAPAETPPVPVAAPPLPSQGVDPCGADGKDPPGDSPDVEDRALYAYYRSEFQRLCPTLRALPAPGTVNLGEFQDLLRFLRGQMSKHRWAHEHQALAAVCRAVQESDVLTGRKSYGNNKYWNFNPVTMLSERFVANLLDGRFAPRNKKVPSGGGGLVGAGLPTVSKLYDPNESPDVYDFRKSLSA